MPVKQIASQRRRARTSMSTSLANRFFLMTGGNGDGSNGSSDMSSTRRDLKRALDAALGSLGYCVAFLLTQVLGDTPKQGLWDRWHRQSMKLKQARLYIRLHIFSVYFHVHMRSTVLTSSQKVDI
jgi:hypothetical protein